MDIEMLENETVVALPERRTLSRVTVNTFVYANNSATSLINGYAVNNWVGSDSSQTVLLLQR